MRTIFLLLLLANLAFFTWAHFFAQPDAGSDPRPLARQIDPQKLPLVTPAATGGTAPLTAPASPPAAAGVPK